MARDQFPPAWLSERCSVFQQRGSAAFQRVWEAAAPAGRQALQAIKETSRKTLDRLRTTPWQTIARRYKVPLLVLGGALLAAVLLVILIKVPQRQAASWRGQPGVELRDLPKLENDARTTLIQALGGAVLLIGLYFTLRNLQLTQDRQITEHYTRAVEQLGSDKLELRLGAIYALERIARDSERDHWPIMEILTAYVREHAPWKETDETPPIQNHEPLPQPTADVQAILTVLGRRTRTYGKGEDQRLNLERTILRGADLVDAQLQGAILSGAQLQGARLDRAQLQEADLTGAQLQRASLNNAQLQGAELADAQLQGANFWNAQLQGASLMGAQLAGARNLTIEQLSTMYTLYRAVLDAPLREQIEQQFSHHRYRCRSCHLVLDAWVPTAKAVDEALVLDHLSQGCDLHHTHLYLERMRSPRHNILYSAGE